MEKIMQGHTEEKRKNIRKYVKTLEKFKRYVNDEKICEIREIR